MKEKLQIKRIDFQELPTTDVLNMILHENHQIISIVPYYDIDQYYSSFSSSTKTSLNHKYVVYYT